MILSGNSLGERQKDLNEKVKKAAADPHNFDKHSHSILHSTNDVDNIFKIDLAAKHKNISFVLEVLKSGDLVYISRALNKCGWIGDDDFAEIINANNLHDSVFPQMSIKMRNKFLCALAVYVNNHERVINFYEYCVKTDLYNIAMKFVIKTPEQYKQKLIIEKGKLFRVLGDRDENLKNFIGDSFVLMQTYLDYIEWVSQKNNVLLNLRYMYSVSDKNYLDLLEQHYDYNNSGYCRQSCSSFGNRQSKEIMKKHKERVLKNPMLYVNILKNDKLMKNSTINDLKVYSVALLPETEDDFWRRNFYRTYKFIIDIIPANERFSYIKKIFHDKYTNASFETSNKFYENGFHKIMTVDEREEWALQHIASGEEMLGSGKDYLWYKYVSFEKALPEIQKYVRISQDGDKRSKIFNILIKSAKTQNDLETLLNLFYTRHINESRHVKERFISKLVEQHRVLDFNDECWAILEKIFHSLDVFTVADYTVSSHYMLITLVYYIVHNKTVPAVYNENAEKDLIIAYNVKDWCPGLGREKEDMVYQYLLKRFVTKVENLAIKPIDGIDSKPIQKEIASFVKATLNLWEQFSITEENIPEIINRYIEQDWNEYKHNRYFKDNCEEEDLLSQKKIIQYVKKDATIILHEFPKIKQYIVNRYGRINWLLRKLKIYFYNDIATKFLQLLNDCITDDDVNYRLVGVAVYGIMKLADVSHKVDFLQKNVPVTPKIDHGNINRRLLQVQKTICGYACVSRPPLPLSSVLQYITGDYVHNCLPMFNYFLANLPLPQCNAFVESLINKPVSIQKHGLRLAFECFNAENLNSLVKKIWKSTKNVSLRKILYTALFNKVLKEEGQTQSDLFEVLKTMTVDFNQDDDDEVFNLLRGVNMPDHLKGAHLLCGWQAVSKLPEKQVHFDHRTRIITCIGDNLKLVPNEQLTIIIDEHLFKMLDNKEILNIDLKKGQNELLQAKWELTQQYIANVYNERQLKHNQEMFQRIIRHCIEMWNEVSKEKYVMREFCQLFITNLDTKSYLFNTVESYPYIKIMLNTALKELQDSLPECEIYLLTLNLRLRDITRDTIIASEHNLANEPTCEEVASVIRSAVLRFAEAFGNLIIEYKNCDKYFNSFSNQIEDYVSVQLRLLVATLDGHGMLNMRKGDRHILMCEGLLKFSIPEIYLLIVGLLPENYKGNYYTDYKKIISTVKGLQNKEVLYLLTEKLVNSNFTVIEI